MNEHERDEVLEKTIKDIPQMSQVQYSTNTQLEYLRIVAHKLGLYDGADVIKKLLENQEQFSEETVKGFIISGLKLNAVKYVRKFHPEHEMRNLKPALDYVNEIEANIKRRQW